MRSSLALSILYGLAFLSPAIAREPSVRLDLSSTKILSCDPLVCKITFTNEDDKPFRLETVIANGAGSLSFELRTTDSEWRSIQLPNEGVANINSEVRILKKGDSIVVYELVLCGARGYFFESAGELEIRSRVGLTTHSIYSLPVGIEVTARPEHEQEFMHENVDLMNRVVSLSSHVDLRSPSLLKLMRLEPSLSDSAIKRHVEWQQRLAKLNQMTGKEFVTEVRAAKRLSTEWDELTKSCAGLALARICYRHKRFDLVPELLSDCDKQWSDVNSMREQSHAESK